ncbi:MAG: hypothetical protein O3A84_00295 [Proteobacteria bacterium]|nr:hypothetical protein [Pseudomonadota bacterium]
MLFGLMKAGEFIEKDVVAKGWYRRDPLPYIQVESITADDVETHAYGPGVAKMFPIVFIVFGAVWLFGAVS